jgi:hypothetical protein
MIGAVNNSTFLALLIWFGLTQSVEAQSTISENCLASTDQRVNHFAAGDVVGDVQYDIHKNPNNGAVMDASGYEYKLGYKQGERATQDPVEVAKITINRRVGHPRPPSLEIEIAARQEDNPKSTAYYKASLSIIKPTDGDRLSVLQRRVIRHSFDMLIDPQTFLIANKAPVEFQQFWQGSPFSAPVSLSMVSRSDAEAAGWRDAGRDGNFSLTIKNDDHEPLNKVGLPPLVYDLGPIPLGRWMHWRVNVVPDPTGRGLVVVQRDGKDLINISNVKIGFNPSNPQYVDHKPSSTFEDVDVLLYRQNGKASQQDVFFDDIDLRVGRSDCLGD